MSEIEEKIQVKTKDGTTINEVEEEAQDIVIDLNTSTGRVIFQTEKIVGEFTALILSSNKKVHVNISSELGYQLFDDMEYTGTNYFPLKSYGREKNGRQVTNPEDCYYLNESLILFAEGQANTDVRFIIRMCE